MNQKELHDKLKKIKATVVLPKNKDGKEVDQIIYGLKSARRNDGQIRLSKLINAPLVSLKTYPKLYMYTNLVNNKEKDVLLAAIAKMTKRELEAIQG